MTKLSVDPAQVESEAVQIERMAVQFADEMRRRKGAVLALPWEGRTASAFSAEFEQLATMFTKVEAQIDGIGKALRKAKDGLLSVDEQIASGLGSS